MRERLANFLLAVQVFSERTYYGIFAVEYVGAMALIIYCAYLANQSESALHTALLTLGALIAMMCGMFAGRAMSNDRR